ncbi:MAG: phosphatidate cytidylyltransferase [Bacteroidota bacterium]|nr:phosphatidate cytidylyltransferase [Bacteroidota bacterium]
MSGNLLFTLIFGAAFLALFGLAELLYHKMFVRAEHTRKMVHAVGGIIALLFPVYFTDHWPVLVLSAAFALMLLLSRSFKLLPSINAVDRHTLGSIMFPIAVYGCFLAYYYSGKVTFFYHPVLILALADPAAALVGKCWPSGTYRVGKETKSLSGSLAFFTVAVTASALILARTNFMESEFWLVVFASAAVTTLTEGISRNGLDNLTIPLGALAVLWLARLTL